jgi:hypothetical protein
LSEGGLTSRTLLESLILAGDRNLSILLSVSSKISVLMGKSPLRSYR